MSLRSFHVVFIVSAVLLGLLFASWAVASGEKVLGALSCVAAVALASYAWLFVQKQRRRAPSD